MSSPEVETTRVAITSYYVRARNCLLVRGNLGPIFLDYELHTIQHGMSLPAYAKDNMRRALAAIALHLTSRPWHETTSWSVNFQEPRFNLFVTGDSRGENVVGRAFLEGTREAEKGLFVAQVLEPEVPIRQSMIEFQGQDIFQVVERFYDQSEQRQMRLFDLGEDNFALVAAQPDCDLSWLRRIDVSILREIEDIERMTTLEKRWFRFHCGCTLDRILDMLRGLSRDSLRDLAGDLTVIHVDCRRCGAIFPVPRSALSLD